MILRPARGRRGPDRTLLQRMAIFAAGAVLAFGGILWQQTVLVWIAIALLAAGMVIALYARRHAGDAERGGDGGRSG